jgi:SAM-dependent methyltransferase
MTQTEHLDAAASPPAAEPFALSRACALADWRQPELARLMREISGGAAVAPHRKAWEFAVGVAALERGGVLHEDAVGLSVAAGHEAVLYYLTNRCRWLFATDLYGANEFEARESSGAMLVDPDLFAPYPYRRRRLTVAYMDALDLRFEDETFDFAVSFGSIEHFGGPAEAGRALAEMARVVRPGGVVFATTEMTTDGLGGASLPGLELFAPEALMAMVDAEPLLEWLDDVDLTPPDPNDAPEVDLVSDYARLEAGDQAYPQVRLGLTVDGRARTFASASLALRRVAR